VAKFVPVPPPADATTAQKAPDPYAAFISDRR
jgi:hypothetical protein